jgi:lipid-binding SYLF domain-containing protein
MQIMIKKVPFVFFVLMALLVFAGSPGLAAEEDLEDAVQETIQRFQMEEPLTVDLFQNAYGYMVFPRIEKGALIVGGAYGEGLVYENQQMVGRARMTHVTLGVQGGGGTYAEVIFFDDQATMNQFSEPETMASQQASAFGPHDSLSTNVSDRSGMSIFTLNRTGGFAEASIGVKKLTFDRLAH